MRSKMSAARSCVSISFLVFSVSPCLRGELTSFIRAPHFDLAKPRRRSPMPRSHHLLRLSLAAIRRTPQRPLVTRADRLQRVPEFRRDSRVRRILHHPNPLAILDLPPDLAAKLKVITLVVNRPRAIGLHQDSVIGGRNQLLESQRFFAGQQTDVSHADHRKPVPSLGAHRPTRAVLADGVRGFARAEIASKQP